MENYRNLNCVDIGDDAKILTLDRARALKGKRIRWTYPAYRMNFPDERECIVGDIITEYELAERTPMKGYSSHAEWRKNTRKILVINNYNCCAIGNTGEKI